MKHIEDKSGRGTKVLDCKLADGGMKNRVSGGFKKRREACPSSLIKIENRSLPHV